MKILTLEDCIKENKFKYYFLKSTNSTMDEIRSQFKKTKNNLIIRSLEQKNGRGRRGAKWLSPPGNIYFSIGMSNFLPLSNNYIYNMIMSVSIRESLKHIGLDKISFKWPNDIFYKHKKISGILIESINENKNKNLIIIGVGLNYSSSPNMINYEATHVLNHIKNYDIDKYFALLINYFFFYLKQNIFSINKKFLLSFKNSLMLVNKHIKIKINDSEILSGIYKGINIDGSLILQNSEELKFIYSGRIIL